MRIAMIGDYPINPGEIQNGPQAVFSYLLEGLESFEDLDIHVVSGKRNLTSPLILQRNGINFYYLPYPHLPAELSFFILRPQIHRILQQIQPDIVHGQSGHRYGAMSLSSGFPSILTCHTIHGHEIPFIVGRFNRFRLRYHFAISYRYFVRNVRYFVSINPYIRNHFEDKVDATIFDIDNPISNKFFNLNPDFENPNKILFVGVLRTLKRPDLALSALKYARTELPDLILEFAGRNVETTLYEHMQEYIIQNKLENHVKFLGHVNEQKLLECYQNASILLHTSDVDTSPMAVQQALASGKPVVVTDSGGTKNLVDHGRNGFVVPQNDPLGLAEAIVKLGKDEIMRRQFGLNARQAALSRFRNEEVAAKTYDAYQYIWKKELSHS